jgi:beta-glucosidase
MILSDGGVVELPELIILYQKHPTFSKATLLGQAGGSAIVDLLFGKLSPCGRLPETMPI